LAAAMSVVASGFPGRAYRLDDLFKDEQRRIVGIVLADRFEDYQRSFEQLASHDEEMLNHLGRLNYPIPRSLRVAASSYIGNHLVMEICRLEQADEPSIEAIERLRERGRAWGYRADGETLGKVIALSLKRILGGIHPEADLAAITARVKLLLDAAALLGIRPELWQVQNQFLLAFLELSRSIALDATLRETFAELATRLNLSPSLLGWKP
jgi:hypothetical protein